MIDIVSGKIPGNYREAVDYIEELPKFTIKHPLEHTKQFMERLGNPAEDRKVIHVAGTNGKGSVCAYMQAILEAEGKRCGFFTSPHLVSVNERIQINRQPIEDGLFYEVFQETAAVAMQMEREGEGHPSYFEFLFGMGMKAFDRMDVEYIILETGLGGRLDATNCIERPSLSVITSVSLDHTDILGDTIEQIAAEKAGIIKKGVPVFFDGSNETAAKVIRQTAADSQSPCREISKNAFEIREVTRNRIAFSRQNAYDKDDVWHVPICGCYQVMNAEIALEAMEYIFEDRGEDTDRRKRWKEAVASVRWDGRMEQALPHLLLDGAHNPGAVEAFVESVGLLYPDAKELPVVIFAAASDKNYEQMIAYLCRNLEAKCYITTEIEDRRRISAEKLKGVFETYTDRKVIARESLKDALASAFEERGNGEVYCLGSLYLAGMVKKLVQGGDYHA